MQFSFSEDQTQFRETIRRFMRDRSPTSDVRIQMENELGYDRETWEVACNDLGLAGLCIPEIYGGAGFGHQELGIVIEEMGRALFCAPYFSSVVLAANAVLNGGNEAAKNELLPAIASGEKTATLAFTEADGSWLPDAVQMIAQSKGEHYRLSGQKKFVIDGSSADSLIVVSQLPGDAGLALFLVAGDSPGLRKHKLDVIDPTRKQANLNFNNVEARLISAPGDVTHALAKTLERATIALSNEMVGGCQSLLEASVEYAKLRMQFGRPIGSFQAIKHKCADMLLDVEHAKSAAYYAAAALDDDRENTAALASLAKATASDAYMRTAAESIQIHGGIGFTWDNDTHLWFKRAKSSEVLLGDATFHRERYLQLLEAA